MHYFTDRHLPKRLILAAVFAFHFIVIGWLVPDFYFKYFDNTSYYSIVQPIPVDKKYYKPCENVLLTATRTSLINTTLTANIELILRKDNETIFHVPDAKFQRNATIKEGKITVLVKYPLPCKLPEGLYYWQVIATYRVHGYERQYIAISDTFNVNQWGNDPALIKIATESAKLGPSMALERALEPAPTSVTITQTPQNSPSSSEPVIINNNQSQSQPQQPSQPTPQQNPTILDGFLKSITNLL